jgi:PAS domain S-box-containing protein
MVDDCNKTKPQLLEELAGLRSEIARLRQPTAAEVNWRTAQRIAHLGWWQYDFVTKTTMWSEETYLIHGCDPTQPPPQGEALTRYIHPDDWQRHQQIIEQARRGAWFEGELRILRPSGEVRYVEVRGEPRVFDETGQLRCIFGTILDVTRHKQTEIKLRRNEYALREAQKIAHIGHWCWEPINERVTWSEELFRIHGLPPDSTPQDSADSTKFIHPDDLDIRNAIAIAARQGKPHQAKLRIIRPDGEVRHIEVRCNPGVFNDQGELLEVFGTAMDITDRHQAEQAKDEFISMVSHELRTPLTSIQMALSLLDCHQVDPSSEGGQAMIHVAAIGVDRLVRLVDDILDLDRLESGQLRLQQQSCHSQDLIDAAIRQMADLANRFNIKMSSRGKSYELYADPDRLVQVLTNLLSNAIRFSAANSAIQIQVEPLSCNDIQPQCLRFAVKDEGRGIPAEKLESIFERFQQVDASDAREKSGTGLGLAICKQIIQQHGGRIWAESGLGQGSTFYFIVPV